MLKHHIAPAMFWLYSGTIAEKLEPSNYTLNHLLISNFTIPLIIAVVTLRIMLII